MCLSGAEMGRKSGIWGVAAVVSLVFASSASAATFEARGSMEQVYATGLPAGTSVSLIGPSGSTINTRPANVLGGALWRAVTPGTGYKVRRNDTNETVSGLTVLEADLDDAAPPDDSIYDQDIETNDYGYMTTRDGTKLAYATHPPTDIANALPSLDPTLKDALVAAVAAAAPPPSAANPAPTLVEYSGYGYAKPDGPVSGIQALANLMGFTVVDVNMRGTGCSGGAFDFFEPAQSLDGYDIVETVANQPWVKGGKVGMLGISYGGISQLFTGQTQPPSLAAITPLSVIDQTQTTLYPGGILNTGFAVAWSDEREREAKPVPASDPSIPPNDPRFGGQPYAQDRIVNDNDQTCKANQALHPEKADLKAKIRDNDHYVPEVADPVSPLTFVDKINVPSFMACQWTDEQTGGSCPTLARKMIEGPNPDNKWFTFTNGVHTDSLDPETYNRLYDFLNIYVAEQGPAANPFLPIFQASAPVAIQAIFGIDAGGGAPSPEATLPPDPIQAIPDKNLAQQQFEQLKPVRVLFDNGAGETPSGTQHPRWPYPGFESSFDGWPVPGQQARSWYLNDDGELTDQSPGTPAADQFAWNAGPPRTSFSGDSGGGTNGLWTDTPSYDWQPHPDGTAVSYATPPLSEDTAVVGGGAVDVWVRASTASVDLQATISEISPDGNSETFVQGVWLKTLVRKLDPAKSTELEPVLSLRKGDFRDMPAGKFVKVTIPLYYQGHMYRQGSRIRVLISAPNGDQPIWAFDEADPANVGTDVEIGYGGLMKSRLLLPVAPGVSAPTSQPACNSLRGEPCRPFAASANPASPNTVTNGDVLDESGGSGGNQGTPGAGAGNSPQQGGSGITKRCSKKGKKQGAASARKKRCIKKQLR